MTNGNGSFEDAFTAYEAATYKVAGWKVADSQGPISGRRRADRIA